MSDRPARDGFAIHSIETGEEIHFTPCTKDGGRRDKVEHGLLLRVDFDRFYVRDTRSDEEDA